VNKTFDRYSSICFAIVGALFIVESRNISASAYGSEVGPNIFPLGLGVILVLLSLRLFWESSRKTAGEQSKTAVPPQYKRFMIMLAATFLYVFLLEPIGYIITTFLFLFVTFQVMGSKSYLKTTIVSLCFSVGVYYLYVDLLKGTLPGFPVWLGM
jgi:putative tricarboxylic transport membrane protein